MFLNEFYKNKKVLVTGNTGFKGSWLTAWLLSLGADVYGYSIDIPTNPSMFDVLNLKSKITHKFADINNYNEFYEYINSIKPDIVFHLAAQPLVRKSYDYPIETFETNIIGSVKVMSAILKTPSVKASVIVTTDKVYKNIEADYEYKEDDELGGKDPYSASKAAAEIAFKSYFESFFKNSNSMIASARAGNVIGGGDWSEDRLIPDAITTWQKNNVLTIRSPKSVRPWQHVLEPLYGYMLLAKELYQGKHHGESFNFAPKSESHWPVDRVIDFLSKNYPNSRWEIDTAQVGNKKESHLLQLSWDKAKNILSWQPHLTLDESLKMTVDWYRTYYSVTSDSYNLTMMQIRAFENFVNSK